MRKPLMKVLADRSTRPELTYVIKHILRLDYGFTREQVSGVARTLKRMEKEGLVTSTWRGRGYDAEWSITAAGRAALKEDRG